MSPRTQLETREIRIHCVSIQFTSCRVGQAIILLARMLANRSPKETAIEVSVLPLDTVLWSNLRETGLNLLGGKLVSTAKPSARARCIGCLQCHVSRPQTRQQHSSRAKALQRANQSYRPLWNDSDSAGKNLFENPEFEGGRFGSDSPAIGTIPDGWVIFRFSTEYAPNLSGASTENQVRQDIPDPHCGNQYCSPFRQAILASL